MRQEAAKRETRTEIGGIPISTRELEDHIRALRRYARVLVGTAADADDIVQETLKRALTYLHDGKEIRNLRSYLLTMLHHVRIDYAKRQGRGGEPLPLDEELLMTAPAPQPEQIACREVADAVQRLPDEQREVLLLVGLEGMTYQHAAEILGVPIGTVMSRLNRGRNAIKDRLGLAEPRPRHPASARRARRTDRAPEKSGTDRAHDGRRIPLTVA